MGKPTTMQSIIEQEIKELKNDIKENRDNEHARFRRLAGDCEHVDLNGFVDDRRCRYPDRWESDPFYPGMCTMNQCPFILHEHP